MNARTTCFKWKLVPVQIALEAELSSKRQETESLRSEIDGLNSVIEKLDLRNTQVYFRFEIIF